MYNRNTNKLLQTVLAYVFTVLLLVPTALHFAHTVAHHHHFSPAEEGIHNEQDRCLVNEFEFAAFVEPNPNFEVVVHFTYSEPYSELLDFLLVDEFIYSGSPRSPPVYL